MKNVDLLIIGTGIAGLTIALKASQEGHQIAVVTKGRGPEGSSNYAQGGIAGAVHPSDSAQIHYEDTLNAGAGLCKKTPVKILTEQGPATIQQLIEWGVRFTLEKSEKKVHYHLALEGGHSRRRILHSSDLTGKEIMRALIEEARKRPNILFLESHFAVDLIHQDNRCWGAKIYDKANQKFESIFSKTTFIATGGIGQLYLHTTNPTVATGDGMAMAFRAGATLEDMEFMQFHPTSLYHPKGGSFLISEAVRGHGGILRNHKGEAFMEGVHPLKDLAPRDIVARAIHEQLKLHDIDHVNLDITHLSKKELQYHFPNIFKKCLELGINISKDMIPVVPAAHYMCGGIKVNIHSESSIQGLYACGEASCTGVHGANRLASNSLLESVVFSNRAWLNSRKYLQDEIPSITQKRFHTNQSDTKDWNQLSLELKDLLWRQVGIVRTNAELQDALLSIQSQRQLIYAMKSFPQRSVEEFQTYKNLLDCAIVVVVSALARKESRGLHFSKDYPQALEREKKHRSWTWDKIQTMLSP